MSIRGYTLWMTWITRLPRHRADCSFVCGESSFLHTAMICSGLDSLRTCVWPRWMKVFSVCVPLRSKNMSSDFSTYVRICGKTCTTLALSSSVFEFLRREQSRSNTCERMEASTTSFCWSLSSVATAGYWPLDSSTESFAS